MALGTGSKIAIGCGITLLVFCGLGAGAIGLFYGMFYVKAKPMLQDITAGGTAQVAIQNLEAKYVFVPPSGDVIPPADFDAFLSVGKDTVAAAESAGFFSEATEVFTTFQKMDATVLAENGMNNTAYRYYLKKTLGAILKGANSGDPELAAFWDELKAEMEAQQTEYPVSQATKALYDPAIVEPVAQLQATDAPPENLETVRNAIESGNLTAESLAKQILHFNLLFPGEMMNTP